MNDEYILFQRGKFTIRLIGLNRLWEPVVNKNLVIWIYIIYLMLP